MIQPSWDTATFTDGVSRRACVDTQWRNRMRAVTAAKGSTRRLHQGPSTHFLVRQGAVSLPLDLNASEKTGKGVQFGDVKGPSLPLE